LEKVTWNDFKKLKLEEKFLFSGHSFIVLGGSLLAFGNLIRLMKGGDLPIGPMIVNYERGPDQSLYKSSQSYFES